jgi:hypothetical protein
VIGVSEQLENGRVAHRFEWLVLAAALLFVPAQCIGCGGHCSCSAMEVQLSPMGGKLNAIRCSEAGI